MSAAAGALAQQKTPKLYKWVDKNGMMHYGSSVPPEYANQQLDVLNSEGLTVKTLNAPKSAQELAKEQQIKAMTADELKQQQQQKATDQMLLDTYTSVADIEQDRDTRLKSMDAQMNVTTGAIAGLQADLAAYQKREQDLNHSHKAVPADLKKNLDSIQQQLAQDQQLLLKQQQQKQAAQDRFDAYIKRFQQLAQNQGNGG